ncbi:MAG: CHAT domain-containing protein [Cyanobacteria bacterium P01_C01_bin.89]
MTYLSFISRAATGGAIAVGLGLLLSETTTAEVPVVPAQDGTGTVVELQGNRAVISGGQVSGANGFHSFTEFGVGTGQTAEFVGATTLENILGRVIGGQASLVNGTIQVSGSDANLFLLNPAGWVFGSGARLDVPGAFTATTATTVALDGGSLWGVGSDLVSDGGAIAGFYFEEGVSGNIANFGTLAVAPGQGLSLLGMAVLNGGQLIAPGGNIVLEAVPDSGWLRLASTGMVLGLEFVPGASPALARDLPSPLTLPELLTGGEVSTATGVDVAASGTITLGEGTRIDDGDLGAGTAIASGSISVSSSSSDGGQVAILGDRVAVLDGTVSATGTAGGTVWIGGEGAGGTALPVAQQTVVNRFSKLDASALGTGDGGEVLIWSESATLFDGVIAATGGAFGGDGGFVEISGRDRLQVAGSVDVGASFGTPGSVLFDPENILIVAGTPNDTTQVGDREVSDGSIFAGDAAGETLSISQFTLQTIIGDVTLEANNNITVDSGVSLVFLGEPSSTGVSQTVTFTADADQNGVGAFSMDRDQAIVASDLNVSVSGASVTVGDVLTGSVEGAGGDITLRSSAGNVVAGLLDTSSESDAGGRITLEATGGDITADTLLTLSAGTFDGGVVFIRGDGAVEMDTVLTNSVGGQGGSVNITANTELNVSGIDTAALGGGNSGAVVLDGGGGSVSFDSINSQSQSGIGGAIAIRAGGEITVGNLEFGSVSPSDSETPQPGVTLNTPGNVDFSNAEFEGLGAGVVVGGESPVGSVGFGIEPLSTSNTNLTLTVGGPVTLNADLNTVGGSISLDAAGDITVSNPIVTQGGNLSFTAPTFTATADINASGAVTAAGGGETISNRVGGQVQITTQGNLSTANISAQGIDGGGTISLNNAGGAIATGNLNVTSTNGPGGTISILAPGAGLTAEDLAGINALFFDEEGVLDPESLVTGAPLGTLPGDVVVGDLAASGASGGSITVEARTRITGGAIEASGSLGSGGTVVIDPLGDVVLNQVRADGGATGVGGTVDIESQRFVRVLNTFPDASGQLVSISASGGQGDGQVSLSHGGSDTAVPLPFSVGNGGINGTAGGISVGNLTISPPEDFFGPLDEGNITLMAGEVPSDVIDDLDEDTDLDDVVDEVNEDNVESDTFLAPPPELLEVLEVVDQPLEEPESEATADIDRDPSLSADRPREAGLTDPLDIPLDFTPVTLSETAANSNLQATEQALVVEFAEFLGVEPQPEVSIPEARSLLQNIETATGVKPALIYAQFRPSASSSTANRDKSAEVNLENLADGMSEGGQLVGSDEAGDLDPGASQVVAQGSSVLQESSEDTLEILLVTADGDPKLVTVRGVTRGIATRKVNQLREVLTNPVFRQSNQYLSLSQELYGWFVEPLREELKTQGIDNLTFVLGPGLRGLPLAALHDGEQFVIENFSVGLMPSLSLTNTKYQNIKDAPVLALGASEFVSLNPLPAVPQELQLVTQERRPGQTFLNESFTASTLKAARSTADTPIVHLATHAEFRPGKASESFIQLWGQERVTLDRLDELQLNLPAVDLLVLSACRTAVGDASAELGFAGLAVASGVKTAIASLWYVSDRGTLGFMGEFYQQLREAPIKAEALRQTQLAMMRGEVRVENGQMVGSFGAVDLPDELVNSGAPDFQHPYFWSAFTSVGSPW